MKKLLLLAILGGGIVAASAVDSPAFAQATKKPATDDKKMADTKPGKIEIKEGKDGKFRFSVHDADGKYLALSAAFKSEKEATAGIDELKKVLASTKPTVVKGVSDTDEKMEKKGKDK